MKKLFLLIALFTINYSLFAQLQGQEKIDSLLKELPKAKNDTNKVNLLKDLSFEYHRINPDKGLEFGYKGLELAKKLNWEIAECYSSLASNYRTKSNFQKALEYYQRCLNLVKKTQNKEKIAKSLYNIGAVYSFFSKYSKALEYFHQSLAIQEKIGNKQGIAWNKGQIGLVLYSLSEYSKSLKYHFTALNINEELNNKAEIAGNFNNIALVYEKLSDFNKALNYYFKALKINKELNRKMNVAKNLSNIALIYQRLRNPSKSLKYLKTSLSIFEELGNKMGIATIYGNIGGLYGENFNDFEKALEYQKKSLKISKEIGDHVGLAYSLGNIGTIYYLLTQDSILSKIEEKKLSITLNKRFNLENSLGYMLKAVSLFEKLNLKGELITGFKNLFTINKELGDYNKALQYHEKWATVKDSVFSKEKAKEIANLEAKRENELKDKQIKIQKLELENASNQRWGLIGGIALLLLFSLVVIKQRANSEKLLLNILPKKIATRLKKKEYPIADHINTASVLFSDIVNFTELSEELGAEKTVKVLNNIYTQIDEMVERIGLEKIKTIGDCYMAVAGVPIPTKDHCERVAQLALEIQRVFKDYKFENGRELKFRIGIDCGEVTAGVIGRKKFIYDLWGDTVNTASRMEEFSEIGKIQCTTRFRDKLVESQQSSVVSEFKFEERGDIEIKGKGMMKTYFLVNSEK